MVNTFPFNIENSLQQQHRLTSTTFVPSGNHFSSNCSSQLTNTSKFQNSSIPTTHTPQIDKKKSSSRDNLTTLGINTSLSVNNDIDHLAILYIALYDYKGRLI
jgi:hypothetical protein